MLGAFDHRGVGLRILERLAHGGQQVGSKPRPREALGHRAQAIQGLGVGRRLGGDLVDRIVLQDSAARLVALADYVQSLQR